MRHVPEGWKIVAPWLRANVGLTNDDSDHVNSGAGLPFCAALAAFRPFGPSPRQRLYGWELPAGGAAGGAPLGLGGPFGILLGVLGGVAWRVVLFGPDPPR